MNAALLMSEALVKAVGAVYNLLYGHQRQSALSIRRFCDPINHSAAGHKAKLLLMEFVVNVC